MRELDKICQPSGPIEFALASLSVIKKKRYFSNGVVAAFNENLEPYLISSGHKVSVFNNLFF